MWEKFRNRINYLGEIPADAVESTVGHLLLRDFLHPLNHILFHVVDHLVGAELLQFCFLIIASYQVDRLDKQKYFASVTDSIS